LQRSLLGLRLKNKEVDDGEVTICIERKQAPIEDNLVEGEH